jgi:recombination protein RecA
MGNKSAPIIQKAKSATDYNKVPVISFGYDDVDTASFCGGVPRGKMIEIFGPESGGKSFLSLKLIGMAQKQGLNCLLVDAENSYDPLWAETHGVDTENLWIIQEAMSAESTLDYVVAACKQGAFGLIVIDSTACLIPQKELDGKIGDQDYALLARAMSKACRQIASYCGKTDTTCVFLNQIREKMNVMFGDNQTTPGGRALKFYSHQRIKVTPGLKVKIKAAKKGEKDIVIARQSWVQFVKNKVARPFGECIIEIVFDQAAKNPIVKLCKYAKDFKIISQRGGTFRISKDLYEDEKTNVETGTKTAVDLAEYLIKNDMVIKIIDAYIQAVEDDGAKPDKDILAMKNDPSIIVSPLDGAEVEVSNSTSPDVSQEEINEEDPEEVDGEDIETE